MSCNSYLMLLLKAGMHIYGRASAKGKRVQVGACVEYVVCLSYNMLASLAFQ